MLVDMVTVPPQGPAVERITDRRSGDSWSVEVEPFDIATTPVTVDAWSRVTGETLPLLKSDLPKVDVTWREAVMFCNALSKIDGLAEVYNVTEHEARAVAGWRPHDQPAPDS